MGRRTWALHRAAAGERLAVRRTWRGLTRGSLYEPDLYDIGDARSLPRRHRLDARRKAQECGGPVREPRALAPVASPIALARAGVIVHALDADRNMLAALRRKVTAESSEVQARIIIVGERHAHLSADGAVCTGHGSRFIVLLHNLTEEDQLACFRRVREHLRPGGRFAFSVFHPSLESMVPAFPGRWRGCGGGSGPLRGMAAAGSCGRRRTDDAALCRRRVHSQHRVRKEYGPESALRRTFLHRLELSYWYAADISRVLEGAGFPSVHISGGVFDGRPFEKDTDELVIEASCDHAGT